MRARLLGIVISLVVLVVIGLGAPLALSVASSEGQRMFLDRLADTNLFASLAQHPLTTGTPALLGDALARYQQVYGIQAAVVDRSGHPTGSTVRVDLTDPLVRPALDAALAGRSPDVGPMVLPWASRPMVIAEPVLVDGELRGAVLTVSPTTHVRQVIRNWWLALGAAAAVAIALAVLAALPVVRWILRPVHRLGDATASLAAAVVSGRGVDPVGGQGGPPELRRLSRSFDQMASTVNDALLAQRSFIADASHQLRNPLTALRLRLGNLAGGVRQDAVEHQEAAVAETDRLRLILDELLVMARAESGQVEPVAVDVDQVVKSRLADWQVVAVRRDVSLVLAGEPGARVLAPPRGLDTVLDALLDNALKFTADGTLVEVEVRLGDERVSVSVRDHGPGLRAEELEHATDRFWRGRAHQNISGSGLGLAIVRRVVERADGSVGLELPEDGGLRVRIELPAAPPGSAEQS